MLGDLLKDSWALLMNVGFERSYPTPLSNSTLLPLLLLSLARQRHSPEPSVKIKREYDYIIVGAGTAGSVVASRLSELPCVSVLLLEAGHEPPLLTDVPALGKYFWFTDVDWQYRTVPQRFTGRALVNRQVLWPAGKMLGGSSSMGGLHYARGNRKNYDDWAEQGAKGWSFKEVYPYFLRMENNEEPEFLANGYHTTGGPMYFHRPSYEPKFKQAIFKAATRMGYKMVDSNAEKQTGFFEHQAALRNNQRCSTAKAYLVPAENRTNLDILTNALVTKININKKQAEGIQFEYKGNLHNVKARHEVIVSAGTINTAQLLMLSGIGPQKTLQKLDIPVIADLPVGENLQDHVGTNIPFVLDSRIPCFDEKISNRFNIHQYIQNRTGPLASTEGTSNLAYLKGQAIYTPNDFPNYQLQFTEMSTSTTRNYLGLKPEVYRKLYGPYEKKPILACEVSQLQPRSRGVVTLRSKNPHDSPIIDPKYLSDPRDIEDMVQGMKTCQRIGSSDPLRKFGARPLKTLIPGCEKYAADDDKYFTCQLRSIIYSHHDPVGTARMGDLKDKTTVVDPLLKVKDVERLRVIDASVMPIIPSGGTMIPTIMIAEKASEMIKDNIRCYGRESDRFHDLDDSSEEFHERKSVEDSEECEKSNEVSYEEEYDEIYKHIYEFPGDEEQTDRNYRKYHLKHSGRNSWSNVEDFSEEEYYDMLPKYPLAKDKGQQEYPDNYSPEKHHERTSKYPPTNKNYSPEQYNEMIHQYPSTSKKNSPEQYHEMKSKYSLTNKNYSPEQYNEMTSKYPPTNKNYSPEQYYEMISKYPPTNENYSPEAFKYSMIENENYSPVELHKIPRKYPSVDSKNNFLSQYHLQHKYRNNNNYSEEQYHNIPRKHPSSNSNKYYLTDYVKDPKELLAIKNEKENYLKPFSWYKKQTDLILQDINKSYNLKNENSYPSKSSKNQPSYKMSKSLEELIKLADTVPVEIDYRWNSPYKETEIIWSR